MLPAIIGKGASAVPEQLPDSEPKTSVSVQDNDKSSHDFRTIMFMVVLSLICALILSVLASALEKPKEVAKELDRSEQMMIAAKILNHERNFLIQDADGKYVPAKFTKDGVLIPGSDRDIATGNQIVDVYKKRLKPMLVDSNGKLISFTEAKINPEEYLAQYRKTGYYKEPLKLIYKILPNPLTEEKKSPETEIAEGYVIPVNGFGLWDAIYGYLAIKPDGSTVIGITWYDQKETPGLGANIADAPWQNLFPGKQIFQSSPSGQTDFKTAPLGLVVVKGKVAEVLGDSPKAKSAVDGMAGATLTGNGVTDAYRDVLAPYRPFLIKLHEEHVKENKSTEKKGG